MNEQELLNLAHEKRFSGECVEAERLYLLATKMGNGHAAHELGVLYITGCEGVEPDQEKSRYWLEKSLALGFEQTIASDPEWFRKGLEK